MDASWSNLTGLHSIKTPAAFLKFIALTQQIEVHSVAEIGVFFGRTSCFLRVLFPNAKLYLIDPWELTEEYRRKGNPPSFNAKVYDQAFRTVTGYFANDPDTKILRTSSKNGADLVPDNLDLVFIDGDHSYESVKEDIALWSKKVRPGGIISGHDYNEHKFPDIVKAVNESFQEIQVGACSTWASVR